MSWSGPVAGAAPYQQPPYTNGQPSYGQQQSVQYGQQQPYSQYQAGPTFPQSGPPQRPPENRPPKKKGNPIITRYPPPPGYRGPAQPQGPFGTNQFPNQYQQPQQPFTQGHPGSSYPNAGYSAPPPASQGYSPPGYGPPQSHPQQHTYPHPGYPQGQNYQWTQQGYSPNQGFSQAPSYPSAQGYAPPPNTYQGYPAQQVPTDPSQQAYPQAQGWQPPNSQASYPQNTQYHSYGPTPPNNQPMSDPNATPTPTSAHLASSQNTSTVSQPDSATSEQSSGEKPQLFLAWDDWDFDFDGAIWPKSNEPVDPNLSLGVIIWRPAKQVTRALPSTFSEAEEQALKPPAEKLGNGESVSIYFTPENSHEAYLDVRQTDDWDNIKDDPIFVVFTDEIMAKDIVPLEECIDRRDRPDWPVEDIKRDEDEEMLDSTWNVMDNLEQALSGKAEVTKPPTQSLESGPSKSQTQEDILAMLGVTGSPKPPSEEPMPFLFPPIDEKPPASLPEKPPAPPSNQIPPRPEQIPQRAHSYGGHRNPTYGPPPQRPYGSMSSSLHSRPSAHPERQRSDTCNSSGTQSQPTNQALDGSRESPARSESSNRTLAGSDFDPEKPTHGVDKDLASILHLKRSDSSFARKRSYEDDDQDDEKLRQQDDHTRRKRRSQVAAAYSRR